MDRTPYQLPFTATRVPAWRCPVCKTGHLTLNMDSFLMRETAESCTCRSHEAWEPDWIRYVFACIFTCNNAQCAEPISCSGVGRVDLSEYEEGEYGWAQATEDTFTPQHFEPSLVLMDIPETCPTEVAGHLRESFSLFFADSGAALNCARASVEALLTDMGVKRFVVSGGKRRQVSLHQRILALPTKYRPQMDLLLAAKWLGNAGSHDGDKPNSGDVRVMYDLLEHVLSVVYDDKERNLRAMAKKVNKKKGPIK